jgi:hypothetical protein
MDALDLRWQPHRVLVQLRIELVDQIQLPIQPLDLPDSESEGEEGHDADENEERAGANLVASSL